MKRILRTIAKGIIRQVVGRLPKPRSRLTGTLAIHGGAPVRDLRFRPWMNSQHRGLADWIFHANGAMRRVFLGGAEGLPQTLAKQFAQRWAEYCNCRFGLLLPHGTPRDFDEGIKLY